jgi:hypothetical protein
MPAATSASCSMTRVQLRCMLPDDLHRRKVTQIAGLLD